MDLRGKAAVVTGSATGVGRAVALALADGGCNVVINFTRSEDEAEETARAVEARGAETLLVKGDVSVDADCKAIVAAALDRWSRLDVLVNNAGTTVVVPHKDLDALTEEAWTRVFDVNVKGAFLMSRAAAEPLRASGHGAIVNVSSTAGITAGGSSIPYAASKAALNNLTVSLARVLAPKIRVNAVAPGFIETRWTEQAFGSRYEAARAVAKQQTPLRDTAKPEHVAQAVLSVAFGMDWMTGQVVVVDGGHIIRQ